MADKKIDRADVTDNTILRIQAFNDKELNALIEKAWGRTRATPADLAKLIDKTRASLYAAPASFERGRKVFENTCGKCHKFDGKGAEVGPPLDGAGRDIEYILVNVLDPNRVIGAPYFLRTARLLDDTVFSGLLAEEDDKTITLKLENAVLKTIKKEDLAEPVRVAEKSLMPEGLGYNMTPQDFRDLVRYVMANPFVTDVTVNGTALAVGVPGRLVLPDTKGAPAVGRSRSDRPFRVENESADRFHVRLRSALGRQASRHRQGRRPAGAPRPRQLRHHAPGRPAHARGGGEGRRPARALRPLPRPRPQVALPGRRCEEVTPRGATAGRCQPVVTE